MVASLASVQGRQVAHLRNFASTVARLGGLAVKELRHECFSWEEEVFLDGMMQPGHAAGYMGPFMYSGGYPQLFSHNVNFHQAA